MAEDKRPGFRVGEYFVTFPNEDFVKEDEEQRLFVEVDIFRIGPDNTAIKLDNSQVTPEIEDMISVEINKMLESTIANLEDLKDD